jgi:phosphoserine phosphatase RsbU/P
VAAAEAPHILVYADSPSGVDDLERLLTRSGHAVSGHLLRDGQPSAGTARLVLVDGGPRGEQALQLCRRLRTGMGEDFVPILFLAGGAGPGGRHLGLESGADACLARPFTPSEVLAQVEALLRIKERHDRLAEKSAEVHRINKRLQAAYQQIDQEMELARRIQLSFLPQSLPDLPTARFAVHYLLCGRVGGDFYDVVRLDESHVGFYVADAMGHGVPASLLTIFIKKGIRAKEIFGQQYRLVPPDEVLAQLNRELVEQELSEQPFITMVYVLFNFRDGTLRFSRAGHPHPIYLPRDGAPRFWELHGSLLGVFDTRFLAETHRLRPGDKVLLYSDGTDAAVFDGKPPGAASLLACAVRHRALPIQELIARLKRDLFADSTPQDDLTLLGLEMAG